MSTEDRRAPGATRMPFDALVEVGGALGPTFEAQAVNVSEEGIHLRTAYLPEAGQTLTCRFDAGPSHNVLASGEVVWAQGGDSGGEFGVRFTDVDMESIEALKTICGVPGHAPVVAGSKVRLHIDGLASPMRAKIRDAHSSAVTVGSDLGFLQVGRPLELEDAQSGQKRPANIDRVDVVVDPTSHVPQLVVTLRYSDAPALDGAAPARDSMAAESPAAAAAPEPTSADDAVAAQMKGAVARAVAGIGPTLGRLAERTKTMAILLAKRSAGPEKDGPGVRRTTAPPPGGGLHASGRKVVRGEATSSHDLSAPAFKVPMNRRNRMVLGGAVLVVAVVGALAIKRGRHESDQATAAPGASVAANVAAPSPPPAATPDPTPAPPPTASPAAPPAMAAPSADETADSSKASQRKHARVAPFANGPVHHGNVLRLKMDGPVESIEGAQQPTGFTVKMPGRKSLEAAAPLAARDSRIAAIRVSNDSEGAELTVAFKDGVPNYRVSAKGDTLIIALATPGPIEPTAEKKDEKSSRIAKRAKHPVPTSPGQPESRSGAAPR
jgi:hypothetical protein